MSIDILGMVWDTSELIPKELKSTRAVRQKVKFQFRNSVTKALCFLDFPRKTLLLGFANISGHKTFLESSLTI